MKKNRNELFIVADHLRTVLFCLKDDIPIEAKGRGYILKKLLKRISLVAFINNIEKNEIKKACSKIIELNCEFYSELEKKKEKIIEQILNEFEKNLKTIKKNEKELEKNTEFDAKRAFFLYETRGIPLELILLNFKKRGLDFPKKEFQILLEKQKKESRVEREKKEIKTF